MPGHDDEQALRRMARAAMSAGILPAQPPERIWGGKGSGSCCAVCARTIDAFELEFELEFTPSGGSDQPLSPRVHAKCFAIWDGERNA